jgi:hypothetical protein
MEYFLKCPPKTEGSLIKATQAVTAKPYQKNKLSKRTGGVTQVIEHLLKLEASSLIPSTCVCKQMSRLGMKQ